MLANLGLSTSSSCGGSVPERIQGSMADYAPRSSHRSGRRSPTEDESSISPSGAAGFLRRARSILGSLTSTGRDGNRSSGSTMETSSPTTTTSISPVWIFRQSQVGGCGNWSQSTAAVRETGSPHLRPASSIRSATFGVRGSTSDSCPNTHGISGDRTPLPPLKMIYS